MRKRRKLRATEVKRVKYLLVPSDRVQELEIALMGTRCQCGGGVPTALSDMRCRKVERTGRVIDGKAEVAVSFEDELVEAKAEIIHLCPYDGTSVTPCCARSPFELKKTDRMTMDRALVTCKGAKGA